MNRDVGRTAVGVDAGLRAQSSGSNQLKLIDCAQCGSHKLASI